jgi:DNA gyrase subunit A
VLCREDDDVMFITESGMIVRSPVAEMRPMGRNTQGVRLVNLKEADRLVGLELVSAEDLTQYQAPVQRRVVPLPEGGEGAEAADEAVPEAPEPDEPEADEPDET